MTDDQRLIEDLIPIHAINYVAQKEKIGHAATHPRKLHLWWARRPLAAARAAVYATLVRSVDTPEEARSAAYFTALCQWGASDAAIADARQRVLDANGGVPPKVLDMFAGGGAIPLEAARLGCEAIAVELNPVAHLIQRAMLEYPQRFGPSLADDIRLWGQRWVEQAWERVGHLYPPLDTRTAVGVGHGALFADERSLFADVSEPQTTSAAQRATGRPIAYLWTRTVPCPNPALGPHDAPLVRQTWLAKKRGRFAALRPNVDRTALTIDWEVSEADTAEGLGFDPGGFSTRGSTSCLLCGAQVDAAYVRREGVAGRMGITPLAAVTVKASGRGRKYHAVGDYPLPSDSECVAALERLAVDPPGELIPLDGGRWFSPPLHGLPCYRDLFTPRQLATLCALAQGVRDQHAVMISDGMEEERARAIGLYLALALDRTVDRNASLCRWDTKNESITNVYARQALPMVWDFAEAAPFGAGAGQAGEYVDNIAAIVAEVRSRNPTVPYRASATELPLRDETLDAVITDPPYYDNISYADLSDFFYVWLKRSAGDLFPDDLASTLTPKRREAIVAAYRHHGGKPEARSFYEGMMAGAFAEANRVLKPSAPLVVVYAHKTTLGWSTLVDALRLARFRITEAWPMDTEMPERSVGQGTSSLATSIFLVARKRNSEEVGDLVEVRRDLEALIAARLTRLSDAGVNGADLVIATMGAALEPYTRYASVELPNGEELPAATFLEEVQRRVLGAILKQIHGLGEGVDAVDSVTRYYVLSRYSYGYAPVDFDEANNLARSANIELGDLATADPPLAAIKKGSVTLHDYSERGDATDLGLFDGTPNRTLIDVVHGLLWRSAHNPRDIKAYLDAARPDPVALRLVAQALQGRALRGEDDVTSKHREQQACERLLGAWNTLVEDNLLGAPLI
jgi:putative DNA methylase